MINPKTIALGLIIGSFIAGAAAAEERIITRVNRDSEGDTTHVCGPPGTWGRLPYLTVVDHIQSGTHTYFVDIPEYPRVQVRVWAGRNGPYLRTVNDDYEENNLDNLPTC